MLSILGTHKLHNPYKTLNCRTNPKTFSVFIISKGSIYIQGNNNDTAIFQIGMYKTVHTTSCLVEKGFLKYYIYLVFLIQKTNPQFVRQIGTHMCKQICLFCDNLKNITFENVVPDVI